MNIEIQAKRANNGNNDKKKIKTNDLGVSCTPQSAETETAIQFLPFSF